MNKIVTILVAAMFFLVSATYSQTSLTVSPTTVTGNTGETVTVSMIVNDFDDIVSMQYGIKWDPSVIQFEAVENFNLTDLTANSFNVSSSANGFFTVAWFDAATVGVSVADGEAIFTMEFTVLGDASSGSTIVFDGSSTSIEIANADDGVITNDVVFTEAQFGDPNGNGGGNNSGNTAPLVSGISSVAGDNGTTVCVDVSVANFTDITAMDYSLNWDATVLQFNEIRNINLAGLAQSNFGTSTAANGQLSVNWANSAGATVADRNIYQACFNLIGAAGTNSTVAFSSTPTPINVTTTASTTSVGITQTNGAVSVNNVTTPPPTTPPTTPPSTGTNFINIGAIDAPAGSTVCVPVTVNDFDAIASLQFSLQWDPAVLQFTDVQNLNIPDLNANSFNTTQATSGQAAMAWFDNSAQGVTLADGATIFEICFTVLGSSGTASSIVFTDTPTQREAANPSSTISFTETNGAVTVDGGTVNPPPTTPPTSTGDAFVNINALNTPAGSTVCVPITVNDFNTIASLQFSLQWDPAVLQFTEVKGFNIPDLVANNFNTTQVTSGQVAVAWFDNSAQGVTLADGSTIFEICFTVLGNDGNNSSIVFTDVPTQREAATPNNTITFTETNGSVTIGDGTTNPPVNPPPTGTGDALVNIAAISAEPGSTICVPVTVNDFDGIASLQFSLAFDPAVLQFSEVRNFNLPDLNVNSFNTDGTANGQLAVAWFDNTAQGVTLQDGSTVFEVCFNVLGADGNNSSIVFTDVPTQREAATANNTITFTESNGAVTVATTVTPPPPISGADGIINIAAISAEAGEMICVPVTAMDFDGIASMQFSLAWDPAVLQFTGVGQSFGLPDLSASSFNTDGTANGQLAVAWFDNAAQGITLADGTTIFEVCFTVLGAVGANTSITFTDVPTTRELATSSETITFSSSNGSITVIEGTVNPPPTGNSVINIGNITGEVGNSVCIPISVQDFDGIASMQFSLAWDPAVLQFTGVGESFGLPDLSASSFNTDGTANGQLAVAWFDNAAQGITLADGTTLFEACFDIIGAVGDMTNITFTDNPTTRELATSTETITFSSSNGTFVVEMGEPIDTMMPPPVGTDGLVNIAPFTAEMGAAFCVPVTVTDFNGIAALQFSLNWDPTVLEFTGLGTTFGLPDLSASSFNIAAAANGELGVAWFDNGAQGITLADGAALFEVCFNAIGATGASTTIAFTDTPTQREAATADNTITFTQNNGVITVGEEDTGGGDDCAGAVTAVATPTNVSCNGLSDGSIAINVSGGDGTYTYQWNDPSIGNIPNPIGLPAGVYSVTISSCGGQEIKNDIPPASLTILEPTAIASVITPEAVSCFGAADGRINVSISGGSAPYTYNWSNPSLAPDNRPVNVPAGSYSLTITDASNCTNSMTGITVSSPTQMTATVSTTPATCSGLGDGSADINVMGGSGPYSFTWSMVGVTGPNPTNLPGGSYTVTIRDASQCPIEVPITIANTVTISATAQVVEDACGDNNGAIQVSVGGGTVPFTYLWTGPVAIGDTPTAENLPTGAYKVRITDANGCFREENIQVGGPTARLSATGTVTDVDCSGDNNGMINLSVAGGFGPYTFAWTNGATTQNVNNLTTGGYTVTITDSKICTYTQNFMINTRSTMSVNVEVTKGAPDAQAVAIVTGGVAPYSFEWCNGQVGESAIELDEGNCSLTVIDALGCTIVQNFDIIVDNPVATIAAVSAITCDGLATGSLEVNVAGGKPGYTYAWSNGGTTSTITNVGAGNYTVTVTDDAANEGVASFDFVGPTPIVIDLSDPIVPSCDNDGVISISVSGGTMPYKEIKWSNDVIGLINQGLRAGEYGVIVTDQNDCTAEENFRITTDETCVPCYMSNKVITPNDDGRNDAFCISCVDLAANNHLTVYNRWGQLVFEADNYQCVLGTESDCWKGLTRANNLVDEGGYFWVLEFDDGGERRRIKDNVTILRNN